MLKNIKNKQQHKHNQTATRRQQQRKMGDGMG